MFSYLQGYESFLDRTIVVQPQQGRSQGYEHVYAQR